MNPDEQFEQQLRRLKPAAPPEDFLRRVIDATDAGLRREPRFEVIEPVRASSEGRGWLRWLWAGASAAMAAAIFIFISGVARHSPTEPSPRQALAQAAPGVEIDKRILQKFDGGIFELPGHQPVQLNCYLVGDEMRIKDARRGLVLEQSAPHIEIIPTSLTVY